MSVTHPRPRLLAHLLLTAGIVAGAEATIILPCEPSRACAIEMARAAAHQQERSGYGSYETVHGLLAIAELQLESGDIPGFKATAAEVRRAADGAGAVIRGLEYLAQQQARAGWFEEALATAADARTPFEREFAYRYVSEEFSRRGRWREALSARTESLPGYAEYAKFIVMKDLLKTGRRDWVLEALPTLAPDREAELLSEFARLSGDLGSALDHASRVTDRARRWEQLFEISKAGIESQQWDDVAAVARFAAAEGVASEDEEFRHHRIFYANEWLCAAGRFDEAFAFVPKVLQHQQPDMWGRIASSLVAANQPDRARELLGSLSAEYKAEVSKQIAIARVLTGEQRFEKALTAYPAPAERLAALLMLAEKFPAPRSKEARDVLRAAVKLVERMNSVDRVYELRTVGELQAKRGFIEDAQATATRIEKGVGEYRVHNLSAVSAAIMKAQAARGDIAGARKTFARFEPQLLEPTVDGYLHAEIINDLATAGLLPEAFAQVQALSRRGPGDLWRSGELLSLIRVHVESGQLRRAFEIAAMVSDHDHGRAEYFLEIAKALEP
jgi:hypothetical protein